MGLKKREKKKSEVSIPNHNGKALSRVSQACWVMCLLLAGCASLLPISPKEEPRPLAESVALTTEQGDRVHLPTPNIEKPPVKSSVKKDTDPPILGPANVIPLNDDKKGGLTLEGYQTVPVLSYHNLSLDDSNNRMTVSQTMFEEQMLLLKDKGYHVISMDDFFDFLDFRSAIPPKSVVITIDDGWRSAYEIAFPILKKYGYPATLFISPDLITDTRRTLSWTLLREMADHGVEIQCHGKSHRNLTQPGKKEPFNTYFANLEKELSACREIIKKNLNREAKYLAYPYGETNPLVIEMAKKLGYRGAFTIQRGSNPFFIHHYRVNRSMIYGDFSMSQFEGNLVTFQEEPLR